MALLVWWRLRRKRAVRAGAERGEKPGASYALDRVHASTLLHETAGWPFEHLAPPYTGAAASK